MEPGQHQQGTQQSVEGKPKKPKKERAKKDNSGTEPKKPKRSTKKDVGKPTFTEASSVPVSFPGYTQDQVSQAFLGGIAAQSIYSSEERKDQPLPVTVPWGLQPVISHVPTTTISHKPEPLPPSLSPSRGHATLPPKKSLSPSRMAFLSEQEKSHSQPVISQYGARKQSDKQENVIQQNKASTISQILSAAGAVSSSGSGVQRVPSPQSGIERWNIGQIDSQVSSLKSGGIEKIHMVQHKPRIISSQPQHNLPFMHQSPMSLPRQLIHPEGMSESGNSHGHVLSQGISADTGGLLRQQLMQKIQNQSNLDSSDLESNVFSAIKHAPSLPTSEASRLTPSPHTLLQQQHQARLEKHREEVKMKGYTTIFRNLEDKTDITQPPRIQIPQDISLKGALSPSMNSPSMKELYPLPAHQDNRLSPASFPVSTIRRTPSPAHMPQEKRSPAPPSSLIEQDKVQPVNLSLQESHGNKMPFGGGLNYPQSSSLPIGSNTHDKQEDFNRYQSISPLSWLVTNQQHYHDNPINPWQQQHYHTPDFSEIRDISPTPGTRQEDKGSPGPSQIISSIFAGGQKQSEILRQTLTSGLPPNVQLAKPMTNQQHQGLLSSTAPPVSQMGQLMNQNLISTGQTGYAMTAGINTKPMPTVRRFEGEIVKRVPQIPSPHSGQRPGRIEKDRTSPHRQPMPPSGVDQNQPITISGNVPPHQIRYTVQSSVSPVGKHDDWRRTPSPKPDRQNRDHPGVQHGISVSHTGGIQPSYTQHDRKGKAPSPKPCHVMKDGQSMQYGADIPSSLASSIVLPQNAGTIRQPFVNLVRLPMPKSDEHKTASTTISQLIQQKQQQQQQQQLLQKLQQQQQQQQQTHELPVFKQEPPHHALALPVSQALSQGQPQPMQPGKTINPFTFPSRPVTSASQRSVPAFDKYHGSSSMIQTQMSGMETMEMKPKLYRRQDSESEMPRLDPIHPIHKIKMEKDEKLHVKSEELVEMPNPFNMRLVNLSNLPTSSVYRSTYRAHSLAVHRAKSGSIQSAAKSMDLLRQNLQKCMNKELDAIIQKYMEKFFKPGINNIKLNNGENSVQEEHIQAVCRQILEEAKKMYVTEIPGLEQRPGCTPPRETDALSDSGSNSGRRSVSTRKRRPSDTDSEKSHHAILKKKRGRPQLHSSGRVTPSKTLKPSEPVKREGPKWNPDRVTTSTLFVMGARANKALGLGATRGRIYIKHPDLFKYSGDQDDKQWLYENHRMPATGGKAYMLVLEDIHDLALTDEYKDSPGLRIDDLVGFTIPDEMIEKVKGQMNALRTDLPQNRVKRSRSRSTTPSEMPTSQQENGDDVDEPKSLPFASFTSPKISDAEKDDDQVSTADTEIEFLSGADNEDQNISNLSPFNLTGGFEEASPSSDMEGLDDDVAPLSAPFELRS